MYHSGMYRHVALALVAACIFAAPSVAAFDYKCYEHEEFDRVKADIANASECNGRGQLIEIYCNDVFGKYRCRHECWHTESHCECYDTDWYPNGNAGRRDQGLHDGESVDILLRNLPF